MQSAFVFIAVALASLASAQTAPQCATDCVNQTNSSCSTKTDINCLCHDSTFITAATQCILTTCKGNDIQAAEDFAKSLCASVGVTLTSTPPIPSSTGSDSGSASPSVTGSDSSSASVTDSGKPSTTAPTSGTASGAPPSATTPPATSGGTTSPSSSSPATSSGAATHAVAGLTGLSGALFAAVLAL